MRVTLIDDTIPFDGNTAQLQPLGGAEKAFAGLAGGLGRSHHEVRVFNRCFHRLVADNATWETWDSPRPEETDILVAHRKPELLGAVKVARKRFLWMAGEASYLEKPRNRALLDQHKPMIVFSSRVHAESWSNPDRLRTIIVPPGMRPEYLAEALTAPAEPPHALTTIHPLHGLDWLIDLWREKIHPIASKAQLHVYSAALAKGLADEPVAPAVAPVLAKVKAAGSAGEKVWQLPMDDELRPEVRSDVADMKNAGSRWGGAITAAMFLENFVGDTPWAHIDIAGPAYNEKDSAWNPRGGTGFGVRTVVSYIMDR